jgi:hypothetical protein
MSKFMVRVLLHDRPTSSDYDRLDMAMGENGFQQELAGKRAAYHLPQGEYWYRGKTGASEVRTRAASAARTLGREFGVIAVRVDGWSVMGLKKVTSASNGWPGGSGGKNLRPLESREIAMRQDVFNDGPTKEAATTDLSAEIIRSISKGHDQRVTCLHVSGDNYRCNWWSPAPTRKYDNPVMRGLLVTTHVVAKSRFLNVVKENNQLVVKDASVGRARGWVHGQRDWRRRSVAIGAEIIFSCNVMVIRGWFG